MEMRLCPNVVELARDSLNEGFAVHFETWDYPEYEFPPILVLAWSRAHRRLPFCPLPRQELTAKDCLAAMRWDLTLAQSLPPFLRLRLEQPPVRAAATRGKFAYGFLAVLHYPVAMILLLLPGSLLEGRRESRLRPVELANALQLGELLDPLPALVKLDSRG